MSDKTDDTKSSSPPALEQSWSIRPCNFYEDEYDDCTSFKARFHQYFINGENTDCTQWKIDYENCRLYEKSNGNDVEAGAAVIKSETERREKRLAAHYANNTWKRRAAPPDDWAKQLPEELENRSKNSYLYLKQQELDGNIEDSTNKDKTNCTIM